MTAYTQMVRTSPTFHSTIFEQHHVPIERKVSNRRSPSPTYQSKVFDHQKNIRSIPHSISRLDDNSNRNILSDGSYPSTGSREVQSARGRPKETLRINLQEPQAVSESIPSTRREEIETRPNNHAQIQSTRSDNAIVSSDNFQTRVYKKKPAKKSAYEESPKKDLGIKPTETMGRRLDNLRCSREMGECIPVPRTPRTSVSELMQPDVQSRNCTPRPSHEVRPITICSIDGRQAHTPIPYQQRRMYTAPIAREPTPLENQPLEPRPQKKILKDEFLRHNNPGTKLSEGLCRVDTQTNLNQYFIQSKRNVHGIKRYYPDNYTANMYRTQGRCHFKPVSRIEKITPTI